MKNADLDIIKSIDKFTNNKLNSACIDILFKNSKKGNELLIGLENICIQAKELILEGKSLIILSDKNFSKVNAPIPALLAVSAVHHFLIKEGLRMKASLIVETGGSKRIASFCCACWLWC